MRVTTHTTGQPNRAALLDGQRRVLERIASGAPLREILETLVRLIEEQADGMRCAVLLADAVQQRLRFVAAPSIPEDYKVGMEPFLRIAPNIGTCGTAAFLREPVYTRDVGTDALWKDCRDIPLRNGLRAVWSTPILSDDNSLLGTFAMYYGAPRLPSPEHIQLIDMATQIARVAIEANRGEELLRTIFEGAPIGIGITDLTGKVVRANPALARLLGHTEAELRGKTIEALTDEKDYAQTRELHDELLTGRRERFAIDKRYRRKDGKVVWAHSTVALLRGPADEPRYIVALIEDITQRKHADDELRRSAAELQALSRRLVELQESERRQISLELHDRIGQNLTALSINLGILKTALASDSNRALRARLEDSTALVESTATAIGNLMSELRPPMLDDHGLFLALDWYAKQFTARTGISVTVSCARPDERLAPESEIALFRIAQEALNNVIKHARASRVDIVLARSARDLTMSVTDDGVGLSPVEDRADQPRRGLGMVTMRERAQALGGRFDVVLLPGGGTRLTVQVPC
jgi:PAS domain S-box-containing protein